MNVAETVCVVDDDPGALRSMRWLLEGEGFAVAMFPSALEFLSHYDPQRTACLVLDVRMPGIDGLQLQKKLLRSGRCPPIVFLTGHGDVPSCAAALKRGAMDFLEKPVNAEALLRAVRQALGKNGRPPAADSLSPEVAARLDSLTPREREVVELLYEGIEPKRIAARFGITFQTVFKHRARAFDKLGVGNAAELVRLLLGDKSPEATAGG